MSYAYRHVVLLAGPHDPITDDAQDIAHQVERVRFYRGRSVLPHADLTMDNPGWEFFAPGSKRAVAYVESNDGVLSTGRVLFRGYIRDIPQDLGSNPVTVRVSCFDLEEELADARDVVATAWIDAEAVEDNEYRADTASDPSARGTPYRDALFGRLERVGDDVLQNRTLHYRHDPVTWAIELRDDFDVGSTVNVAENYMPDSFQRSVDSGVARQVKMKLVADLDTEYVGVCDIANWMNNFARPTSLTGFQQNLSTSLGIGYGWSLGTVTWRSTRFQTPALWTGDVFDVTYRRVRRVNNGTPQAPNWQVTYDAPYTLNHWRRQYYDYERIQFTRFEMNFNYKQARREVAYITLNLPVQDTTGIKNFIRLPTVTLSDLYSIFMENYRTSNEVDPIAPVPFQPLMPGQIYAKGSRVSVGGRGYEALVDGVDQFWSFQIVNGTSLVTTIDPRWKDLNMRPPIVSKEQLSFFDQPRGMAAIAHALQLMRTKGLDLISEKITLTVDRDDFDGILFDTDTEVHFLILGSEFEPLRAAKAMVKDVVEDISGDGDTVTLTLLAPRGLGVSGVARRGTLESYVRIGSGYFSATSGYLRRGTAFHSSGRDIEFTVSAPPLVKPIEPSGLRNQHYVVVGANVSGSHEQQIAAIEAQAERSFGPISVPVTTIKPVAAGGGTGAPTLPTTKIVVSMRGLNEQRILERRIDVAADLLFAPAGIEP